MKWQKMINVLSILVLGTTTLAFVACGGSEEADPTPSPTAPPATPTPDSDDAWSVIQAKGLMSVGIAADYPPFSFYTSDFQLDGYDIALIRAIADELDVEVELHDMAFDGLGGALQVEQIDAAIAAISVTEEREQSIDFSNIYFISEDAILAAADSPIELDTVRDMASYRVGVQSGSVYQEIMERELVESGLMPASNLHLYTETDQMIEDVANGLIDLVVADAQPLELAAESGLFEIVRQGLNRQRFAVALPNGSTLTPRINEALVALNNDGTLQDLAQKYMGLTLEDILPPPTPGPQPTATMAALPPTGCVDAMSFVADLNLDDEDMTNPPVVAGGTSFQKGWRIRNTGTCTWDARYLFTYVGGNVPAARMGGTPTPIQGTVPPGGIYDMNVNLVAPLVPGVYQGFWSMRNPGGLLFGDRVWVGITVPGQPTPTPMPTVPPSASISFTVNRTNIIAGECVVFNWNVQNANAVYFYAQGQPWHLNPVPPVSQQTECPPVTSTYELRVIKIDGSAEVRQIRIDVRPPVNQPVIEHFNVTPAYQIQQGQCVDVTWKVSGDVSLVRVSRSGIVLWDSAPLNGTFRDCPPAGEAAYKLEASGSGGTSQAQNVVSVIPPATPPPQATATSVAPTATPEPPPEKPPIILAFSVVPGNIDAGQCVSINWSVGGNASLVQIKRDGVIVLDNAPLNGNATDCLNNQGTYTYRVEASNSVGETAFHQAAVVVGSSTPPIDNPLLGTSWRLATLNGAPVLPGTEITAQFGDSDHLSGSGGCNTYNGNYQVSGQSLSISGVTLTQQICQDPPGVMEQENSYIATLGTVTGFSIENGRLTIRGTRGSLIYDPR